MCITRVKSIPALLLSLLMLAAVVVTSAGAANHMPPRINYQGHLLDDGGSPLTGNHNFVFAMYDSQEGGNLLWSEEHLAVPVEGGLFEVVLGSINDITADVISPPSTPVNSFFDIWIEISVDGQGMQPRVSLTSAPYAMMTHRVDGDITTSPGGISMGEQVGFNYQKISWNTGGGQSYGEMEASDGFSVTKAIDKSSPLLYQSLAQKKEVGSSDSLLTMRLIESDTIWFMTSANEGMNITGRIDKSSPLIYVSTVESGNGISLTKAIDKATPGLLEASMESSEGLSLTKKIDQSSPLLYQSTVESSDGVTLVQSIDKSTPQLYKSLAMKKSAGGSDSLMMMGLIESDTIWFSMSANEGMNMTSRIDKATPQLMQSIMESGSGPNISKEIDQSSPLLAQSLGESTDGATMTKAFESASPKLATVGAHYRDIEGVDVGDSGSVTMVADTAGVGMRQSIDAGDAALQAQLNTSTLPAEEVSLRMTSSGGSLPTEEICVSTGPGSDPAGMWMFSTTGLTPINGPADTNFQVCATAEGGTLEIANVGGTSGDGMAITITDDDNSLRIRHGGANTGVYLEADPSTGGRIGINNEAPSEALQVSGNICASGSIGVCSDVRFKTDIQEIPGALDKVTALRGVRYSWKQADFPERRFADGAQVGLIAQEVLDVVPEVVLKSADGFYSVDYGKLTPLLVEAVKELKAQNDELRRRLEALEKASR